MTTAGNDKADAVKLGEFSGGRGASTTPFTVYFESAGDYAMQSQWYEGGGGATLEWFTIRPNKALLNDTANGGLKTFATKPSVPALVTSVSPSADASGQPSGSISAVIEDADGTVNAGSVSLSIDGVDSGASASKSGGVTTITAVNSLGCGSWTGSFRYLDLFCRDLPAQCLVLDGDQLRDLSQGLTPVGSGSDAGLNSVSINSCWPWKQHRRCRVSWQVCTPMVLKTSPILPVALFPMTMHVLESYSMWMV